MKRRRTKPKKQHPATEVPDEKLLKITLSEGRHHVEHVFHLPPGRVCVMPEWLEDAIEELEHKLAELNNLPDTGAWRISRLRSRHDPINLDTPQDQG